MILISPTVLVERTPGDFVLQPSVYANYTDSDGKRLPVSCYYLDDTRAVVLIRGDKVTGTSKDVRNAVKAVPGVEIISENLKADGDTTAVKSVTDTAAKYAVDAVGKTTKEAALLLLKKADPSCTEETLLDGVTLLSQLTTSQAGFTVAVEGGQVVINAK